jgi:hypothetical protein
MRLNLQDPPDSGPLPGRPRLWLVPRGPSPIFHRVEDPPFPWRRRAIWGFLALVITTVAVIGILLFAALVKHLYDTADEAGRADPSATARQEAPEGAIPLSLSDHPPASDDRPEAGSEPEPAAGESANP